MSETSLKQPRDPSEQADTGLNLAFTLMQGCLASQLSDVDTLDTKANAVQVAATTLISAALVLEAALLALNASKELRIIQAIALLPLLIAYGFTIYFANKGYGIRIFQRVPTPKTLLEEYYKPVDQLKKEMLEAMESAFSDNQSKMEDKARNINKSSSGLKIETLLLIAILIFQVVLRLFIS